MTLTSTTNQKTAALGGAASPDSASAGAGSSDSSGGAGGDHDYAKSISELNGKVDKLADALGKLLEMKSAPPPPAAAPAAETKGQAGDGTASELALLKQRLDEVQTNNREINERMRAEGIRNDLMALGLDAKDVTEALYARDLRSIPDGGNERKEALAKLAAPYVAQKDMANARMGKDIFSKLGLTTNGNKWENPLAAQWAERVGLNSDGTIKTTGGGMALDRNKDL